MINNQKEVPVNFKRTLLSEHIATHLRHMILRGELEPGQTLTEQGLVKDLGASRTPIREAIQSLIKEGLIKVRANRRMRIYNPSQEEILDQLILLQCLEATAGRLAAKLITENEILQLEECQKIMLNAAHNTSNDIEYFDNNNKFHKIIVGSSRNKSIIQAHSDCNNGLYRHRFLSSKYSGKRDLALSDHQNIIDSLKSGDVKKTEFLLYDHLQNTQINLKQYWKNKN